MASRYLMDTLRSVWHYRLIFLNKCKGMKPDSTFTSLPCSYMQFNGLTGCYASKTCLSSSELQTKETPAKWAFRLIAFSTISLLCCLCLLYVILVHASKMHESGHDKCPKKLLLKFKEHKILRVGGKKDTAVRSSKRSLQMTWFHDSQPLQQECNCKSPWGLFTMAFKVQNTLEFISFVWACLTISFSKWICINPPQWSMKQIYMPCYYTAITLTLELWRVCK